MNGACVAEGGGSRWGTGDLRDRERERERGSGGGRGVVDSPGPHLDRAPAQKSTSDQGI